MIPLTSSLCRFTPGVGALGKSRPWVLLTSEKLPRKDKMKKTLTGLAFAVALLVGASTAVAGQSWPAKSVITSAASMHIKPRSSAKNAKRTLQIAATKPSPPLRNARIRAVKTPPKSTKSAKNATSRTRRKKNNLLGLIQRPNIPIRPLLFRQLSSYFPRSRRGFLTASSLSLK